MQKPEGEPVSHYEPRETDPNDANPHYPGSTAWFDPGVQAIHRPWEKKQQEATPMLSQSSEPLPNWAYLVLAPPVFGAVLATDPATPAAVRWGWFPALVLAALFVAGRLLRRAS